MKITDDFLNDLEAKAKAATLGKWECTENGGDSACAISFIRAEKVDIIDCWEPHDGSFVVAAQPAHVLAMIAALRDARQTIARLREDMDIVREEVG